VSEAATVAALIDRARLAQQIFATWSQADVDAAVDAAAWAILEPKRNQALAEVAVRDSGLGNVADKIRKNHRKTLGLLRDLKGVRSVGVIADDPASGITEVARPAGVVAAVTPSTNPAATPANKLINALKGGNAIILAPSPKGASTCALLLDYVHAELAKVGAPEGLVQQLPGGGGKALLGELLRQADLVVATGSQVNVRAAYASGTPSFGVGAGNVAAIVLPAAEPRIAAARIAASKTFDHATSCSSENSLIVVDSAWPALHAALLGEGGVLLAAGDKQRLADFLFRHGKPAAEAVARPAGEIARRAGLHGPATDARFLMVEETNVGPDYPYSGEKLAPVLTVYRVADFAAAVDLVRRLYAFQGAGHSVGIHGGNEDEIHQLAHRVPAARVIVDQVHCAAVGGAFDNGLPFSLSMGCGTWGGNNFSDNLNYRHFLNITRIVRPIPAVEPRLEDLLGDYWRRYGP
jgi:sulfoacetaldehyde dehydrogenase